VLRGKEFSKRKEEISKGHHLLVQKATDGKKGKGKCGRFWITDLTDVRMRQKVPDSEE